MSYDTNNTMQQQQQQHQHQQKSKISISQPNNPSSLLVPLPSHGIDTEMNGTSAGVASGGGGGYPMSRGLSVSQGSVEMLRSMSMSGSLGMPVLQADMWERRPSGRVLSEEEVNWFMGGS